MDRAQAGGRDPLMHSPRCEGQDCVRNRGDERPGEATEHERLVRVQVTTLPRLMAWTRWRFDGEPLFRLVR